MFDRDLPSIGQLASTALLEGKKAAVQQAQQMLMPHILDIFADHDHEDLELMIRANYPLVAEETPQNIRNALDNLGSNEMLREQYEAAVLTYVTPENILHWMHNPEEWIDDDATAEQKHRLRLCALTIEDVSGGRQWLEAQVLQLYTFAGIVPEQSRPSAADD